MSGDRALMLSLLGQIVTTGTVTVSKGLSKVLQVTSRDRVIVIDINDKQLLKQLLPHPGGARSLSQAFKHLRTIAQSLKEQNLTLTIAYQSTPLLRLGKDANPHMTPMITGSHAIEFSNILRLLQLIT